MRSHFTCHPGAAASQQAMLGGHGALYGTSTTGQGTIGVRGCPGGQLWGWQGWMQRAYPMRSHP